MYIILNDNISNYKCDKNYEKKKNPDLKNGVICFIDDVDAIFCVLVSSHIHCKIYL